MKHLGYFCRINSPQISDAITSKTCGLGGYDGAHHCERGVYYADNHSVHCVGEGRHVKPFSFCQPCYFIVV